MKKLELDPYHKIEGSLNNFQKVIQDLINQFQKEHIFDMDDDAGLIPTLFEDDCMDDPLNEATFLIKFDKGTETGDWDPTEEIDAIAKDFTQQATEDYPGYIMTYKFDYTNNHYYLLLTICN